MEESSSASFDDFQQFSFELQTIARQNFAPQRIKEYLMIIYLENGGLAMCQNVLDYFIVVLSKYLQMMVSYHIYKEDLVKVAHNFEQFNQLYESFCTIFMEVTTTVYKPGCKGIHKAISNPPVASPWDRVLASVSKK